MTDYAYTPWIWPLLGSAALNAVFGAYLWQRRRTRGAIPLLFAMAVMTVYCVAEAGELAATQASTKQGWFIVRDWLLLPGVTASLWFAIVYAGLERYLTRPVAAVLLLGVVAIVPFYFIDGGALLWSRHWVEGRAVHGELNTFGAIYGLYGYAVALVATGILLLLFVRSPAHRVPAALILLGQLGLRVIFPIITLNLADIPNLAGAAFAVDLASLMYVVALFRFRLFDLVPVARETILARMPDGLLVLDPQDRVADLNAAAATLLEVSRGQVLRRPAAEAFAALPDLLRCLAVVDGASAEATLETGSGSRTCEIRSTPLADWQNRPIGRLILLHDTSALRRVEAQLVDQERALAAAQERERLARELHDGLAQDLWLAKLKTGRLAAIPELSSEASALTDELDGTIDAALTEAREAVSALRLAGQSGPLRELIGRALDDFEDRFGLSASFDCDPDLPSLPARTESEILRIVHEALTNVRRHADATSVRVHAHVAEGVLELDVADNGRGFDPELVGSAKFGLAGMRERAALIGGELRIETAPHKGTQVHLRVPLTAEVPPPELAASGSAS